MTPYDNQSDVVVIGQNYQQMGREMARAMTPKALPTSKLDPIPLTFMQHEGRRKNDSSILTFGVHGGAHHNG